MVEFMSGGNLEGKIDKIILASVTFTDNTSEGRECIRIYNK
jgi:hypothetical protein